MRDHIRRTIARHIRHLSTAIARPHVTRREVCPTCRCRVPNAAVCIAINHAGDPT
jgi:hypothetical protein